MQQNKPNYFIIIGTRNENQLSTCWEYFFSNHDVKGIFKNMCVLHITLWEVV